MTAESDQDAQRWAEAECWTSGHEISRSRKACRRCGMTEGDVMRKLGAVRVANDWVFQFDSLAPSLPSGFDITYVA